MKRISSVYIFFLLVALFSEVSVIQAATKDSEGKPIVYLRGDFANNWSVSDSYKFTRNGNTYTLVIGKNNPVKESKFKIADEDWSDIDFGGSKNDIYVNSTTSLNMTRGGANLRTKGINEGVISFELPNNYAEISSLKVTVRIDSPESDDPTDPDPGNINLISGTLPVMYINVYSDEAHTVLDDELLDYNLAHKDYFTYAEYWLDTNGCKWMEALGAKSVGSQKEPLPLQIKARGNWTRTGFSKKPFKLKLDKKQDLLGLTPEKSKHYALLAHADDQNGFLRNFTFFNLGKRIGLPWTPNAQPVELVINGDYRGLYFLTESIRVQEGRIDIAELEDNVSDSDLISGGYIVELDNYYEDNQIRMKEKSWVDNQWLDELRITWDTPEEYSDLQKQFVTDQFSEINDAIGSNSNVSWSYLDLDDAARYYLVCEIISHTESYHGSTYLYRDRGEGEKWHFSPLWDAGNAFQGKTDNFFYNCDPFGNTWIPSMRENNKFNEKVKETWKWFMQNQYPGLETDIENFVTNITAAATADYNRWGGEPVPSNGGQKVADNRDMSKKMSGVKGHLNDKIAWLKKQFGDYSNGVYKEPERDDTPAAPLPEYAVSAVENISIDEMEGEMEYYTLQGVRIQNPKPGEIYIIRKGNRSVKALLR